MAAGVYQITCRPTGKRYVGSSGWCIAKRWKKHQRDLEAGKHHSAHLQHAWRKYGAAAFDFEVLILCRPNRAVGLEQELLDRLRPEFNVNVQATSCLGTKRTPEQRERYAAAARRRHAEGRGAMHGLLAHVKTEEHRAAARLHALKNQPAAAAARRRAK